MRSPRLPALLLIAGAVAGGLVLASSDDPAASPSRSAGDGTVEAGVAMPAARPAGSLSSTWYCAGGTGEPDSLADHTVLIENVGDEPLTAAVTVLAGEVAPPLAAPEPPAPGATTTTSTPTSTTTTSTTTTAAEPTTTAAPIPVPEAHQVELPPRSRTDVRLGDLVEAQLVSAVIEVAGGEVAVEHTVVGDLGRSTAPCATTAAETWTFPWGSTLRGNRELLIFMNPFPEAATVDVTFATDEGVRDTRRFEGFPIPARSVVGAFIDQDVQRRALVAAHVEVRSGRIVADRIQTFDGTDGRRGMTLGLGAPVPAEVWVFPNGGVGRGVGEQVVVFNPTEEVAEVEVEVRPERPGEQGVPEPFSLTVPPRRFSMVALHREERIAQRVPYSIFVRSLNGVPVVAERALWAREPSARFGVTATLGAPLGAGKWSLPAGTTTDEVGERVTLVNLSDDDARVTVTALDAGEAVVLEGLQDVVVPPAGRLALRVADYIEREQVPLVIEADQPIVVERELVRIDGIGMSDVMGIPFADDTVVVPRPLG